MKQFILAWVYGNKAWPIIQGSASLCQSKRTQLKGQPQYSVGKLIVRTMGGFKANPLWTGKQTKSNGTNRNN